MDTVSADGSIAAPTLAQRDKEVACRAELLDRLRERSPMLAPGCRRRVSAPSSRQRRHLLRTGTQPLIRLRGS